MSAAAAALLLLQGSLTAPVGGVTSLSKVDASTFYWGIGSGSYTGSGYSVARESGNMGTGMPPVVARIGE
jgi:hypothetical protein